MDEYKKWIDKARDDLLWTQSNLNGEIWYGACFTAQQAVEKALKGFLLFHKKPLRKIHDVRALLNDCGIIDNQFEQQREHVIVVAPYYIETRYPDFDFEALTKEQAEEAFQSAQSIVSFVENAIKKTP